MINLKNSHKNQNFIFFINYENVKIYWHLYNNVHNSYSNDFDDFNEYKTQNKNIFIIKNI